MNEQAFTKLRIRFRAQRLMLHAWLYNEKPSTKEKKKKSGT